MSARKPEVRFSSDDRRLLVLLARLLTGDDDRSANFAPGAEVVLSDSEARELLHLLEEFASSKRFIDGSHFVEALFSDAPPPAVDAREIYLQWRKRNGRTRAMASTHWREFLVRVGSLKERGGYLAADTAIRAERMNLHHFLEMERILLQNTGLSVRVQALVLKSIAAQANALERIRNGERALPKRSVIDLPRWVAVDLQSAHRSPIGHEPMSTSKIVGIITLVTDMSAMFTTRDWSVAGTLSTMAGALTASTAK